MRRSLWLASIVPLLCAAVGSTAAGAAPSPGMVAVAGGTVDVGDGDTRRSVTLAGFFIDARPATVGAYRACVTKGACPRQRLGRDDDAAARVDWEAAERLCAFQGKRLPSEAEWEAAARTGAVTAAPATTTSEGARTAQARRGASPLEWTGSWFVAGGACASANAPLARASRGTWAAAVCGTVDPLDACDGVPWCGSLAERVLKDPSAPSARSKGWGHVVVDDAYADAEPVIGAGHLVRCASTTERLTASLAVSAAPPPPRPADPPPPSPAELAKFRAITEDTLDVPTCEKPGRSFVDCRDPRSYLKTNEPRIGVVLPWVKDRGGGYAGVASDQNYTFVAHARSQWVWLFDYDENVVRWHRVLRALVLEAPDRHAFVALFSTGQRKAAVAAIERHAADDPQRATLVALFRAAADNLRSYYVRQETNPTYATTWLGDDALYSYIRLLYQQGRMRSFKGNMLDAGTMRTIGDAARALGVPIRIYYPSNAPEFWPFSDQYRSNVRGFPFDEHSMVVQTISSKSLKTGFGQQSYWHYNVQGGLAQQQKLTLKGITRHRQLLWHRTKSESSELTLSDVAAAPPHP